MDNQPKYLPQSESQFFYDGATMRSPVSGTVARGELREDAEPFTGRSAWGFFLPESPVEVTESLVARGRERYQIYCSPCHGGSGDGLGMLFQRSQIKSGNLLDRRIREMPDGQIFDVITNGAGLMPSYGYPIPPEDRWAIVAWVRRLQEAP
jgi:mono/diheme cytochrome c family protein